MPIIEVQKPVMPVYRAPAPIVQPQIIYVEQPVAPVLPPVEPVVE